MTTSGGNKKGPAQAVRGLFVSNDSFVSQPIVGKDSFIIAKTPAAKKAENKKILVNILLSKRRCMYQPQTMTNLTTDNTMRV
jgi:phosphoenolpyruvate carboxylase